MNKNQYYKMVALCEHDNTDTTNTNEILLGIKDILMSMNNKLEPTEQVTVDSNTVKNIDDIRPLKTNEQLVIRNFKTHQSTLDRIQKLKVDTGLPMQVVFNYLINEILESYGY